MSQEREREIEHLEGDAAFVTGLPGQHFRYVKHIEAGMPLFLFNFVGLLLHGIFEAASDGALNINPNAWQSDKTARTQFPAQVIDLLHMHFLLMWF